MNPSDFLDQLQRVGQPLHTMLFGIAMASARLFAAFAVFPPAGDQFLKGLTRSGLVTILGAYVALGLPAEALHELSALETTGLMVKEVMLGLLLGFAGGTVFWVAESVGALIDMQAGYNSVQLSNPLSGQSSTPVSNFMLQLVVAMFYVMGGMLVMIGALFDSYKVWPLLSPLPSATGFSDMFFLRQTDTMMTMVVKFAAPVLVVLLLIDLSFGLITKAADKLEPNSLSHPVKGAVTMLLLALMIGVFIMQVRYALLPTDLLDKMKSLIPAR